MAENKKVDKEKYLDEIEDSIRTIGILKNCTSTLNDIRHVTR